MISVPKEGEEKKNEKSSRNNTSTVLVLGKKFAFF
jgi:hypothetical protein